MAPEGTAAMLTLTAEVGFTVMVMALEVAGFPVGQGTFEVRIQVMISPLTKAALV